MPKPLKKAARRDANQRAHDIVQDIAARTEGASIAPGTISAYMAQIGRKGGEVGGKRRLETMTPEQRSAVALKAARARWRSSKKR